MNHTPYQPPISADEAGRRLHAYPALVAACKAGAAYSDALLSLQEQHPTLIGTIIESADLDPLFKDWHDKTHAVLDALATAEESAEPEPHEWTQDKAADALA